MTACGSRADRTAGGEGDLGKTVEAESLAGLAKRPGLFGVNTGEIGTTAVPWVAEIGARRVRAEFVVSNAANDKNDITIRDGKNGYWDSIRDKELDKAETAIDAYRAIPGLGVRVCLTLGGQFLPRYQDYLTDEKWPVYVDAWAHHVRAIVERLKDKVDVWELWNEPDLHGAGEMPPPRWVTLFSRGSDEAKAVHPTGHSTQTARVISGVATTSFWRAALVAGQKQRPPVDILAKTDAINLHPYGNWPAKDQTGSYPHEFAPHRGTATHFVPQDGYSLAETLEAAAKLPTDKPFWFTEWGVDINGQSHDNDALTAGQRVEMSAYVDAFFRFFAEPPAGYEALLGRVHEAYFYTIKDYRYKKNDKQGNDVEQTSLMGLLTMGGQQTPAWRAFHEASAIVPLAH